MTEQFWVIGHRGAAKLAPENTIPSFTRAIEEKVHGIELDVHWVDNQLVVIHDETVDRTSNGVGCLQDYSFNSLRNLDFGGGAIIPTLEEVIETITTKTLINVELKGESTGKEVARVLSRYQNHRFMVSSFRTQELVEFTARYGSTSNTEIALLGVRLTNQLMQQANELKLRILSVSSKFLQKKQVNVAIQRGFRVYVYTVNHAKRASQLQDIGVSGVFTDNPAKLRSIL